MAAKNVRVNILGTQQLADKYSNIEELNIIFEGFKFSSLISLN